MRAHSLLLLTLVASLSAAGPDWPHYGGGPEQTRYSPLTQITPANVGSLKVAWTYDTGDAFKGSEMQCQPVVAHGVLYATSPKLRVFALDAATGALNWSFDTEPGREDTRARTRIRGLMYWEQGERPPHLLRLAALVVRARREDRQADCRSFGQDGRIDLREGFEGRDPRTLSVGVNTPGVFYQRSADPRLGRARGPALGARRHSRVRRPHRPAERWAFHTIPHPGELGYDTWPADAWKYSGGANAWSGVSLDEARGLVLRGDRLGVVRLLRRQPARATTCSPTASSASARRPANASGTSRASSTTSGTGISPRRRAHHDHEGRRPPRCRRADRRRTDALYVLDRETGQPLFPMEEIQAPASDDCRANDGRHAGAADAAAALHTAASSRRTSSPSARRPPTRRCGSSGSASARAVSSIRRARRARSCFPAWMAAGSGAARPSIPTSGLLYVNANEMAWMVKLAERKMPDGERRQRGSRCTRGIAPSCHKSRHSGQPPEFPSLVDIAGRRGASTNSQSIVTKAADACRRSRSCTARRDARSSTTS